MLGLATAELLIEMFAHDDEGDLARRYNRMVRRETCSLVAQDLGLGPLLRLAACEEESGGRRKPTILADACEAVLGAVFLDGGYDQARGIVRRLWMPYLQTGVHVRADPKSALQEWAQSRGLALPKYVESGREGPHHAPIFSALVKITGLKPGQGTGPSKRIAEQAAAAAVLVREGVWRDGDDPSQS